MGGAPFTALNDNYIVEQDLAESVGADPGSFVLAPQRVPGGTMIHEAGMSVLEASGVSLPRLSSLTPCLSLPGGLVTPSLVVLF